MSQSQSQSQSRAKSAAKTARKGIITVFPDLAISSKGDELSESCCLIQQNALHKSGFVPFAFNLVQSDYIYCIARCEAVALLNHNSETFKNISSA